MLDPVRESDPVSTRYDGDADYSPEVLEDTFARFRRGAVRSFLIKLRDFGGLSHVETAIVHLVARLTPTSSSCSPSTCRRPRDVPRPHDRPLRPEVQLYVAYLDLASSRSKRAGFSILPSARLRPSRRRCALRRRSILRSRSSWYARALRIVFNDLRARRALADHRRHRPEQRWQDDLRADVRSAPLPRRARAAPCRASSARLFLFRPDLHALRARGGPRDAAAASSRTSWCGCTRSSSAATADSVLIMNESFGSTTLARRARARRARSCTGSIELVLLCVFVTFVDELASLERTTVSMVSTVDPDDPADADLQDRPQAGRRTRLRDRRSPSKYGLDLRAAAGAGDGDEGAPDVPRPGLRPRRGAARTRGRPDAGPRAGDACSRAMADGDQFLFEVARAALLASLTDPERDPLPPAACSRDCLEQPDVVRELYELAVEAHRGRAQALVLRLISALARERSCAARCSVLEVFVEHAASGCARSPTSMAASSTPRASRRLFATLQSRARRRYLATVEDAPATSCSFRDGVLLSAELGEGNKGIRPRAAARPPRARAGASGSPASASPRLRASRSPTATRPGFMRSASCADRGDQPGRQRARASRPITSSASSACCGPSSAFYVGVPQPARAARARRASRPAFPTPHRATRAAVLAPRARTTSASRSPSTSRVVGNDHRGDGNLARGHHRRQPGRQVHVPAQRSGSRS